MGKQSGGTKKGRASNQKGSSNGGIKKQIASYQKSYASNIESDFSFYDIKGVVGQLIGNSIQNEVNSLTELISSISSIDTYSNLDKFISDVDKQFSKAEYNLDDKISVIEHNMQGVTGNAKNKYIKAKDELNSAIYNLRQLRKKYTTMNLVEFSEFLFKNKLY